MRCEKNPILKNGERMNILKWGNDDKHWDLCNDCFSDCFSAASIPLADVEHQKKYFEKYRTYGKLKCKGVPLCLWYGVRPPDGTDEYKFVKRIKKFMSSKCIEKAIYAFEWKYQDSGRTLGNRYGMHCHMLIVGEMKRVNQHIERQVKQGDKYFLLDEKQKFWIYPELQDRVKDKLEYFVDGKTDEEEKDADKEYDKKVRIHLGLDQVYYKECDLVTLCDLSSS